MTSHPHNDNRLAGKTALITGAGGTLSKAMAIAFAESSVRAMLLTDIRPDALDELAESLESCGVPAPVQHLEVTDGDAFERATQEATRSFGGLDLLVNHAGAVSPNARIHNLTTDQFDRCLRINLTGTFHGIRAAAKVMHDRGGAVINIASVAGITAWTYASAYCAAKAGVMPLTRVPALEMVKEGIRVNCVCPGAFASTIHSDLPDEAMQAIESRHPLGLGQPSDVIGAIVYLASEEAGWTTGQAIVVDGGYSLP